MFNVGCVVPFGQRITLILTYRFWEIAEIAEIGIPAWDFMVGVMRSHRDAWLVAI